MQHPEKNPGEQPETSPQRARRGEEATKKPREGSPWDAAPSSHHSRCLQPKTRVTVRVPQPGMGNPRQRLLPPPHAGSKLSRAERSSCPSRHGARSSANKPARYRAQPPLACRDHRHRGKRRRGVSSSISSPAPLSFVGHAVRGVLPLRHRLGALRRASSTARCQRHPKNHPH